MNIIWALRGDYWWAWDLDVTRVPANNTTDDVIAELHLPSYTVKIKRTDLNTCRFKEFCVSYMTLEDAKLFAEAQYRLMKGG